MTARTGAERVAGHLAGGVALVDQEHQLTGAGVDGVERDHVAPVRRELLVQAIHEQHAVSPIERVLDRGDDGAGYSAEEHRAVPPSGGTNRFTYRSLTSSAMPTMA